MVQVTKKVAVGLMFKKDSLLEEKVGVGSEWGLEELDLKEEPPLDYVLSEGLLFSPKLGPEFID